MPAIARVEPLTTSRNVRGPFDYAMSPELAAGVGVGSLLVVPFGRRRVLGVVVELATESAIEPERLAAPIAALEQGVPAELVSLAHWIADAYCSTPARALGLVLPPGAGAGGGAPRIRERTALVATLTDDGATALADGARLGPKQREALERLQASPGGSLAAADAGTDHGSLRRLEARGLVTVDRVAQRRSPILRAVGAASATAPELTAEQAAALAPILAAIESHTPERFLLHGVTGSGKTEVYLGAVAAALAQDRGAILLVPEIAMTPQLITRVAARFGDTVALLHSQLSDGERYDEWLRLRRGEARVAVGPRSAVFAPVRDLGLIVIDEEHEPSYKHEGDPRYDARSVAAKRATVAGAVLVCGSATPRPESYRALRHLRLERRVDGSAPPAVEIVDMRGARSALHPRSREALEDVRRARRKAIVLLNRRGWSNFLSCRDCGQVWRCPDCDVALVLHRAEQILGCHHCGHREPMPSRCEACGSLAVARHGAGTERLEAELAAAFADDPGFPVFRLDADTATGRGAVADVLARFEAAPAGVLVGTQMVAKGHDFPEVTLGLVLDADATLRFPDFRSEERTFSLVAQLAGRAGRGADEGRVLVQTLAPEAGAIVHAARHDSDAFLAEELERRAALRYPPFATLIRIVCAAEAPGAAEQAAGALRAGLTAGFAGAASVPAVLGPAPLFRLRGRERSQVVVKAADRAAAVAVIAATVAETAADKAHRAVSFSVDVDPQ